MHIVEYEANYDYITSFISILNPDINIVSVILWLNAFTLLQIA